MIDIQCSAFANHYLIIGIGYLTFDNFTGSNRVCYIASLPGGNKEIRVVNPSRTVCPKPSEWSPFCESVFVFIWEIHSSETPLQNRASTTMSSLSSECSGGGRRLDHMRPSQYISLFASMWSATTSIFSADAIMADWTEASSLNQSRSPYLLYRAVAMAWWIMNTLMGALSQSFDDEDAVNNIVRCVNKIQPINIINVALEGWISKLAPVQRRDIDELDSPPGVGVRRPRGGGRGRPRSTRPLARRFVHFGR